MPKPATAKPRSRARTISNTFADRCKHAISEDYSKAFPLTQYQHDPVRYVLERLQEPHVMPHQVSILEAIANGIAGKKDPKRPTGRCPSNVAVRSCQKAGKTKCGVWACLWRYECFPRSRTFICAAIVEQAKNVLWRELNDTVREAHERGVAIDGVISASPSGGLISSDGSREIRGVSGRDVEALAGLSGNLFTWIDEASHLPEGKAQAFAGNTLGGGARLLTSNPTRTVGPFFDAFHKHSDFWATFHINGEDVAQWQEDMGIFIPYVISKQKIEEFKLLYGEDSPFYVMRVRGDWLLYEEGKICKMSDIVEAQARYTVTTDNGVTNIGYDPAGVTAERGDWHVWTVVRGDKFVACHRKKGLDTDAAVAETLAIVNLYRRDDEWPIVKVDSEGVGASVAKYLCDEAQRRERHEPRIAFRAYGVKTSSGRTRNTKMHRTLRDELWWGLADWLKHGAIPPTDSHLEAELYAPSWEMLPSSQLKATDKSDLRNILGRSPDHADSLALAVYDPDPSHAEVAEARAVAVPPKERERPYGQMQQINRGIYGSLDWMDPRRRR